MTFLSKVLEKAALSQFLVHCDEHALIPGYQSAYRRHFSCETAIAKMMSDVLNNMENGNVTATLFMDLSAAFDTVDHDILINVLRETFHVDDSALEWFRSYLSPRWSEVVIEGCYSKNRLLQCSVPQGSCLGPTLYNAYASTLRTVVPQDTDLHGYADDHTVKKVFSPTTPGQEELTLMDLASTMTLVDTWMGQSRLKLNPDKTEFILFASRQRLGKCVSRDLSVIGATVQRSPVVKYLGVLLDQNL